MSNTSNAATYVLAAVILGIGILGALLTLTIPAYFSAQGGNPGRTAGLAAGLVVLTVSLFIVKRNNPLDGRSSTNNEP
ncbi:MAG: hypothetical protein JJT89_15840 [Nitriliruptoraceae bacterium]|nr:hypothetical protein [Nitriliruptoraceae bacterium]